MAVVAGAATLCVPAWRAERAEQAMRIALASAWFGRAPVLAVAARSTCRAWQAAAREAAKIAMAPGHAWSATRAAGWCASFPLTEGVELRFSNRDEDTDAVVAALSGLAHLRHVEISPPETVGSGLERQLQALPRTLTRMTFNVEMHRDDGVLRRFVAALPSFPALAEFEARLPRQLTPDLVAALPATLTRLVVHVDDVGVHPRVRFTHLTRLTHLTVPPDALCIPAVVASITPHLTSLKLTSRDPENEWDASVFSRWPSLRDAKFPEFCCDLSGALAASLQPSLRSLSILFPLDLAAEEPTVSLAHLTSLEKLVRIDSEAETEAPTPLYDALIRGLAPSLRHLDLTQCSFTRELTLAHLPALEVVELWQTEASDALVASLPASVTHLGLAHCSNVTPACSFAHLPRLHTLFVLTSVLAHGGVAAASLARSARSAAAGAVAAPLRTVLLLRAHSDGKTAPRLAPDLSWAGDVTELRANMCDLAGWDLSPMAQLHTLDLSDFCTNIASALATAPPSLRMLISGISQRQRVGRLPPSLQEVDVDFASAEMVRYPPPSLRVLRLRAKPERIGMPPEGDGFIEHPAEASGADERVYDWSGTVLEELVVSANWRCPAVHRSMFATLPPTLRVLQFDNLRLVAPPPAAGAAGGAGGAASDPASAGGVRLDLTHLPALVRCDITLASGHVPVTVAAMGREWVVHAQARRG
jgi:hypothetical protein